MRNSDDFSFLFFFADHLEEFYVDLWEEMAKFGDIEQIYMCENTCDHLIGNVYVKFFDEEVSFLCDFLFFFFFFFFLFLISTSQAATAACGGLAGRFYAGRALQPEFSPVTDFREGSCRQHETKECTRAG